MKLNKEFALEDVLGSLPEEGMVVILGFCSDDRTQEENYDIYEITKNHVFPHAHVKQIVVPGAFHALMDNNSELEIQRQALNDDIALLTKKASAVFVITSVHEMCLHYGENLSRQEINEIQDKEIENLPDTFRCMLGEKFRGIAVLRIRLDECGEKSDGTEMLGGMLV
jgi:hypothetical protein